MLADLELMVSIGALIVSILGYTYQHYRSEAKQNERLAKLEERTKELVGASERLAKIETKMDLLWQAVEKNITRMLHSPTHLRKDGLLDRFPDLSTPELKELEEILRKEQESLERKNPHNFKLLAYALLIGRIHILQLERNEK